MKAGFAIQGLIVNIMLKMMLVYMKWSKIRVVLYKLCLLSNCAMLVSFCVYLIAYGVPPPPNIKIPSVPPNQPMPSMPPIPPMASIFTDMVILFLFA
jgi:hypothetical protein